MRKCTCVKQRIFLMVKWISKFKDNKDECGYEPGSGVILKIWEMVAVIKLW